MNNIVPSNEVAPRSNGSPSAATKARAGWNGSEHPASMDIARPDLARKRLRRRWFTGIALVAGLAVVTIVVMRLKPAAPRVDRATVWIDTVKRGEMLRQVRGNGTLVPERLQYVQADSDGRIERIFVQAGALVTPETVLLELSNPELRQSAFDIEWQIKGADAQLTRLRVQLESEKLTHESTTAQLAADLTTATLEAKANEILAKEGLVGGIENQKTQARATELRKRVEIEGRRGVFLADSAKAQLVVQDAEIAKLKAQLELKKRQVANLQVRAGIEGVLQQVGDREQLQVGQRVAPGATLAKVVQPQQLKAVIKVAETQARDIQIGLKAEIDTRNGIIPGQVIRIDPSSQNGTVAVDIQLNGALPKGARPDLSVEGTIELERLSDVLHVGRPVQGQPESKVGLFRIVPGTGEAVRIPVRLGRSSVSTIEIIEGLNVGDQVILSDMSQWDSHDRVRIN